jgi:hypothetical protein
VKHFKQIILPGLDIALARLRSEISSNEDLWSADESRQNKIQVQRHTHSIPLRSVDRKRGDDRKTEEIHESRLTRFAASFPVTMSFLSDVAISLRGTLERALYVRLHPHSVVYPHVDAGAYYAVRDRYHFVLISSLGSLLKSGDEEVTMLAGELWWFDNKALHQSENPSDEWRVHLIFDIF